MRRVKIAELKDRLSEHLRAVENGEEVVVTDRDRPIAKIIPYEEALRRVRFIPARRPFSAIRDRKYPSANWKINSTELLLEDRRKR